MKKAFFVSGLLIAGSVFATESVNLIGYMPVTSSTQRTIVAVPWCECSSTDNTAISISNVVETANLTVGDQIVALSSDGAALNTWNLTQDASSNRYWSSVKQVTQSGSAENTISASQATVARGSAIMLLRKDAPSGSFTFYLRGQVPTSAATSSVAAVGTSDTPAYNLIAAPSTSAQGLNQSGQWSGTINGSDEIVITQGAVQTKLNYVDGKWGFYWKGAFTEFSNTIPMGTGFWYVSRGGSPTITWSDVPTK